MLAIIATVITVIGIIWFWMPMAALVLAGVGIVFAFCYLALPDILGAVTRAVKAVVS